MGRRTPWDGREMRSLKRGRLGVYQARAVRR